MLCSLSSGLYFSTAMSLLFSRARLTDSSSDSSRVGRSGDVGGGDGRGAAGSWARAPAGRPNDAAKINVAIARLVRSMSERPPPFAGRASQTPDYSRGSSGRSPIIRRPGLQTRRARQKIPKSQLQSIESVGSRRGRQMPSALSSERPIHSGASDMGGARMRVGGAVVPRTPPNRRMDERECARGGAVVRPAPPRISD